MRIISVNFMNLTTEPWVRKWRGRRRERGWERERERERERESRSTEKEQKAWLRGEGEDREREVNCFTSVKKGRCVSMCVCVCVCVCGMKNIYKFKCSFPVDLKHDLLVSKLRSAATLYNLFFPVRLQSFNRLNTLKPIPSIYRFIKRKHIYKVFYMLFTAALLMTGIILVLDTFY